MSNMRKQVLMDIIATIKSANGRIKENADGLSIWNIKGRKSNILEYSKYIDEQLDNFLYIVERKD